MVATVRVPGSSSTKKLVHVKWIAFAICLFLNDITVLITNNFFKSKTEILYYHKNFKDFQRSDLRISMRHILIHIYISFIISLVHSSKAFKQKLCESETTDVF